LQKNAYFVSSTAALPKAAKRLALPDAAGEKQKNWQR